MPLTEAQWSAVREAYRLGSYRRVAAAVGVSHHTINTIVHAVPGDPIWRQTYNKLVRWMARTKYGTDHYGEGAA